MYLNVYIYIYIFMVFYTSKAFLDLLPWVLENFCLLDCYLRAKNQLKTKAKDQIIVCTIVDRQQWLMLPHAVLLSLCWWNPHSFGLVLWLFLGTSDPYVKFKIAGKEVFRSKTIHKNLNPVWDEKVTLLVDNIREPLYVKVRYESLIRCAGGSETLEMFYLFTIWCFSVTFLF